MAAPVDAERLTTDGSAVTTNHTLNLHSGTINAGELLFCHARSPIPTDYNWPAGWTILRNSSPDPADDQLSVAYKIADGTEGTTMALTLGTAARMGAIVWRITGTAPLVVEDRDGVTGTSTAPNSPSVSLGGGVARDVLYLTLASGDGTRTFNANPTGYANPTTFNHTGGDGGAGSAWVAGASKQVLATTGPEDAGAWGITVSSNWSAYTFPIYTADTRARVSQDAVEAILKSTDIKARFSQDAIEAVLKPDTARARVSRVAVEALILQQLVNARLSSMQVEAVVQPPSLLRMSHAGVEVLIQNTHEDSYFYIIA